VSRVVGVIGGMGPAATLDFYAKLIAATPATREQDHLRVLIDSNPGVPDRNLALAGGAPSPEAAPGPVLADMARGLERAGADLLVMACNTAHAFEADIRRAVAIPFVSIITETADAVRREHPTARRVGLLAAAGCLEAGLYQRALAERGAEPVVAEGALRERFMTLLYRVKLGEVGQGARDEMRAIAEALIDQGAEVMVAACTEVPLVIGQEDLPVPLIDSSAVLARRAVALALAAD